MCKSFQFANISTNTTTVVKGGPAILHTITINKSGASSNTISVYNHPSSATNPIAVIDGTAAAGRTLIFDVSLSLGLTIVTATGTAADITVSYE
jgi:hypothetical protein